MAACFGVDALSGLLTRFSPRLAIAVGHLGVLAGAVAGSVVALDVLWGGAARPLRVALPDLFPFARLSLSVDGLSAFFLLVVSLVAAAIYGPAYLRAHRSRSSSSGRA